VERGGGELADLEPFEVHGIGALPLLLPDDEPP
jgi:hypothetical protein